jgi:hypothetical protein
MTATRRLPGGIAVNIVGESFYATALAELVGALAGDNFGGTMKWAAVVPEPQNPYDPNAVAIVIDGKKVGYLSRDNAIVFAPVAQRIVELGCEVQCAATIVGGGGRFGVVLDLGTPEACLACLRDDGDHQ